MRMPDPALVQHYHQMSEGRARIAIELIDFDPKYTQVMQFVFGSTFITEDNDIAKQISGGRGGKKGVDCVTLKGDKYSNQGTLQGGSIDTQNNILASVSAYQSQFQQ